MSRKIMTMNLKNLDKKNILKIYRNYVEALSQTYDDVVIFAGDVFKNLCDNNKRSYHDVLVDLVSVIPNTSLVSHNKKNLTTHLFLGDASSKITVGDYQNLSASRRDIDLVNYHDLVIPYGRDSIMFSDCHDVVDDSFDKTIRVYATSKHVANISDDGMTFFISPGSTISFAMSYNKDRNLVLGTCDFNEENGSHKSYDKPLVLKKVKNDIK